MNKIITLLVIICMIFTTMVHNVYATDFEECDFYIYSKEFVAVYQGGNPIDDTPAGSSMSFDEIPGLDLEYANGEYTLYITDDVVLTANENMCDIGATMIYVGWMSTLNIVGNNLLTLKIDENYSKTNSSPTFISLDFKGRLNIGLSDNEEGPTIYIKDESDLSENIKSAGICSSSFNNNISINNAIIEITTSEYGIKTNTQDDDSFVLDVNDSIVNLICKDNDTYNDYHGISYDSENYYEGNNINLNDSVISFTYSYDNGNNYKQPIHCIETSRKLIMDNCYVYTKGENSNFVSLIEAGSSCEDPETCVKIVNSHIETTCNDVCISSLGRGDLFIEDSYINICSVYESAIKVCNNINIKFSPDKSTNSSENQLYFSIKAENPDENPICYEVMHQGSSRYGSRDPENVHHLILNIAPTLNFYFGDDPEYEDVKNNTESTIITKDLKNSDEVIFDSIEIKKEAAIVHFDSNGGTPNYDHKIIENYGDLNLSDYKPTKSGYTFGGWYYVLPDNKIDDNYPISNWIETHEPATEDFTIRVKWIEETHNADDEKHENTHKYKIPRTGIK